MFDVKAGETVAHKRAMIFDLRGNDGIAPALLEAGGQPQISINLTAWTNIGIGVLVAIGNGTYYALVDTDVLDAGNRIRGRYDTGNTAETPAEDEFRVVAYDPWDMPGAVNTLLEEQHGAGDWEGKTIVSGSAEGGTQTPIEGDAGALRAYVNHNYDGPILQALNWDSADYTEFLFTIKKSRATNSDDEALIAIRKTPSGVGDGLIRLNGVKLTGAALAWASLEVDTSVANRTRVIVHIKAPGMTILPSEGTPYEWEVTRWKAADDRALMATGTIDALAVVWRGTVAP